MSKKSTIFKANNKQDKKSYRKDYYKLEERIF